MSLIIALLLAVGTVAAIRPRRDTESHPGLDTISRTTYHTRLVCLVISIVGTLAITLLDERLAIIAPAAIAGSLIIAQIIAEVAVYRRAQEKGIAALEVRTVSDFLPFRQLAITATATLALVGYLFTTSRIADDSGRTLSYTTGDVMNTAGPFPGTAFSIPIAISVALLSVLLIAGLAVVARRPRNGADSHLAGVDDQLRRASATGMVAAVGIGVAVYMMGTAYFGTIVSLKAPAVFTSVFSITIAVGGVALFLLSLRALNRQPR